MTACLGRRPTRVGAAVLVANAFGTARLASLAAVLLVLAVLAGCSSSGPTGPAPSAAASPTSSSAATSSARSPTPTGPLGSPTTKPATSTEPSGSGVPSSSGTANGTPSTQVRRVLAALSEAQRVGQLLLVDCPSTGVSGATRTAIERFHVGSVILDGTTTAGVRAVAGVTSSLRAIAPRTLGLLVASDQEGGTVQRLQGPGFATVPSALAQGRMSTTALERAAVTWGRELRAAGVDVDLAPVLDTVPAGAHNPPIGDLDREFGHDPATVADHGVAVVRGLTVAGVAASAKHFPGLGRVTGNTDTSAAVSDPTTPPRRPYLAPFRAAVRAGVPLVMMSTAAYPRIAPGPAAFSPVIVTSILRGDLGFRGVIVSDDLGVARQVAAYSPGQRAVRFVAAGGDLVLTVDAGQAAEMTQALLARAGADPAFRAQVDAAAARVLSLKADLGLLRT